MRISGNRQTDQYVPSTWRGLFATLSLSWKQPMEAADAWFQNEAMSKYGSRPDWADLLQYLSKLEPVIVEGKLKFCPCFCQFTTELQNNLLLFLLKHKDRVQTCVLADFVDSVCNLLSSESWPETYIRMLKAHVLIHQDTQEKNINNEQKSTTGYCFTSKNSSLLNSLRQTLQKNGGGVEVWRPGKRSTIDMPNDQLAFPSIQNELSGQKNEANSVPSSQVIKEESDVKNIEPEKMVGDKDVTMIHDEDENVDEIEEPPSKRPRIEDEEKEDKEDTELKLDPEIQEKLGRLIDHWSSGNNTEVPDDIDIFYNSNLDQMKKVCNFLSNTTISDVGIATACHHLATISDVITHDNCVVFLSHLLLPQYKALQQTASRAFSAVMSSMAEKFPKPLIDGVLIPCVREGHFCAPQVDITIKVVKEILLDVHRFHLLKCLSVLDLTFDDNMVAVIQAVIDCKTLPDVDDILLDELLKRFKQSSQILQKSLKFGKVLVAFINKFGQKMRKEQVERFSKIVHNHSTFLKKTLDTSVKKLRDKD